jgi:hypothetical protein
MLQLTNLTQHGHQTGKTLMSKFLGVTIDSPYAYPENPVIRTEDLQGQTLDPNQPISSQGNPKWYYKRLRMIPSSNMGWNRNFYLPPGASTPIMIDQAYNNGYKETCAWTLYISRPDVSACVVNIYDVVDSEQVVISTTSTLQRPDMTPNIYCQYGEFPELEPTNATFLESWSMSAGSMVFPSGQVYYSVTNTGTEPVCLVTLSSFSNTDLRDLLDSPVVTASRSLNFTWRA